MGNILNSCYTGLVDMTQNIDNSMPDVYKQGDKYKKYVEKVDNYRQTMSDVDVDTNQGCVTNWAITFTGKI